MIILYALIEFSVQKILGCFKCFFILLFSLFSLDSVKYEMRKTFLTGSTSNKKYKICLSVYVCVCFTQNVWHKRNIFTQKFKMIKNHLNFYHFEEEWKHTIIHLSLIQTHKHMTIFFLDWIFSLYFTFGYFNFSPIFLLFCCCFSMNRKFQCWNFIHSINPNIHTNKQCDTMIISTNDHDHDDSNVDLV